MHRGPCVQTNILLPFANGYYHLFNDSRVPTIPTVKGQTIISHLWMIKVGQDHGLGKYSQVNTENRRKV